MLPIDASWLSDFLKESSTFPGGANDDQLDPMFDAIKDVQTLPVQNISETVTALPTANRW